MLGRGYGGAERAFVDTCLALSEAGHSVLAIVDEKFYGQEFLQGHQNLNVAPIKILARWDPVAKRKIRRILGDFNPDIAHIHLRRALAVSGTVISRLKIPMVASLHNYGNVKAFARADMILALTGGHQSYIESHPGFSKARNRVQVVPNFSRFPQAEPAIPEKGALRLLAYGRFVEKKGFDVLLNAFAKAVNKYPELRLTLVGDGPEKVRLSSLAETLALGGSVTFSGWTHDVVALLDAHDVFILPSRSEPFGIVLLEAMARGKGIISTTTEGPGEFLSEQECFFCTPGDVESLAAAMKSAASNRGILLKKAIAAHNLFSQEYQQSRVLEKLVSAYEKTLPG